MDGNTLDSLYIIGALIGMATILLIFIITGIVQEIDEGNNKEE